MKPKASMRLALFVILFHGLFLVSFHISSAFADAPWQSRIHECHNENGFERRLELQYQSSESPLPCRAVWFRGDVENFKIEHVLIVAQNETGKCEAAEEAYLSKMKSWDVTCQLVTPAPKVVEAPKSATEIPSPAPVVQEAAPRGWSGFYVGAILGEQFGHSKDTTGDFGYNADDEEWDYSESGLNAAAELGYNFVSRNLVVGPEVELGYLNLSGNGAQPDSPGSDTLGKSSGDFYTAIRARVGVDFNRTLIFATGGVMGVDYQTEVVDSCSVAPCGGSTVDAQKKDFKLGYTFGAGVERLLESGWSIKLEYLYFNLGSQNFSGSTNLGEQYNWTGQTSGNIVRGGLNYHF